MENPRISWSGAGAAEAIVREVVQRFLEKRLQAQYPPVGVRVGEGFGETYQEKRRKLAKETFQTVREQTGRSFVDLFTFFLLPDADLLSPEQYQCLWRVLTQDAEQVRVLTLMALSAAEG